MTGNLPLQGKNILITGATAGIGRAAAEELARMGASILGVSRSPDKCARIAGEIRETAGNENVVYLCANLALMDHVRQTAADARNHFDHIDVLINNVGAIFYRRDETEEGFERTFALNHLSGFLLTNLLLAELVKSAPARIVNVSSSAQFSGRMNFDDLQLRRGFKAFRAYGQSKLANMLFTYELDRKLQGTGVTVNALHPGLVRTNIGTNDNLLVRMVQKLILSRSRSPEKGAETLVYLAASPAVAGVSGKFFIDRKAVPSARASYREADAARLWSASEDLLQAYLKPEN